MLVLCPARGRGEGGVRKRAFAGGGSVFILVSQQIPKHLYETETILVAGFALSLVRPSVGHLGRRRTSSNLCQPEDLRHRDRLMDYLEWLGPSRLPDLGFHPGRRQRPWFRVASLRRSVHRQQRRSSHDLRLPP